MWNFWHYTQFLWNAYSAPSIGPDVSDPQFQKKNSYFFRFCIIFYWIWSKMTQNLLGMTNCLIMTTLCFFLQCLYKFWHTFENDWWLLKNLLFSYVAKTCKITEKTNNIWILWSQMSLGSSLLLNLKGPCNLGSFFCQKSGRWWGRDESYCFVVLSQLIRIGGEFKFLQ